MPEETTKDMQKQRRDRALLRVALRGAIAQASDAMIEIGEEPLAISHPKNLAGRLVKAPKIDSSQVRNLENLAYTTGKVSDITDLLKRLIGRDSRSQRWAHGNVGGDVLVALEALRAKANQIVRTIPEQFRGEIDPDLSRRIHLELCREFVKHLAAEFMYQKKQKED